MAKVSVTSLKYFRGLDGEGENEDGMVKPGDVMKVENSRFLELKANGLVDKSSEVDAPEPEPKAAPVPSEPATTTAAPAMTKADPVKVAAASGALPAAPTGKPAPITTASLTDSRAKSTPLSTTPKG